MTNRAVRAGQVIDLRARFLDDLGDTAQASGVYVHIFQPDSADLDDLSEAYVVSGVPVYLGEGIFSYEFTPPGAGPDGIWYDVWEGWLTGQALDADFQFEVSADGTIEMLPESQLWENNLIQVTIASGIQATDSSSLASAYEFEFMTTVSPAYTNIRKILLKTGGFITGLEDDTLQMAILEASIEADSLTWASVQVNTSMFQHARREFTTCLAASMLLTNLSSTSLKAKTLGDLHVEYDPQALRDTLQGIEDCLSRWEPQVMAGGGAKVARNPSRVVKGDFDPDRPIASRMWQSTEDGTLSRRIPAANTRERDPYQRRYQRTYRKRNW